MSEINYSGSTGEAPSEPAPATPNRSGVEGAARRIRKSLEGPACRSDEGE